MDFEYEADWKVFSKKLPFWQERFMDSLITEYIRFLMGGGDSTQKFWALKKRIKEDAKKTALTIEMSRGQMYGNIVSLMREGAITMDDLDDFSPEYRKMVQYWIDHR